MKFLETEISPLGMGCWPIGGAMFSGGEPLGYAGSNDAESIRTIHAALANGITLFDTAPAYGAGHAERLLGQALQRHPDALVVTKMGISIDEETRQLTGDATDPDDVMPSIDHSLSRLRRDRIDLLLFHQNDISVKEAEPVFAAMEKARLAGKIRAYGWSSDFPSRVKSMTRHAGFVAVEHAMNVLLDAPDMQAVVEESNLTALIRSPLAMGLLSGKYDAHFVMPPDDIRATGNPKTDYFRNAQPNPAFLNTLDAIRDLLTDGGRSLTQGALGWLWAKSEDNIPIPGARTVEHIEGIAEALRFGPLPGEVMRQIEDLLDKESGDKEDRAR